MLTIISIVVITMVIAIMVNVKVVYVFVENEKKQMDDNMSTYHFQEAIQQEIKSFEALIKDRSSDNEVLYQVALKSTKTSLQELPQVYTKATENRYSIIWNIKNAYGEYEKQRDKFISMSYDDPDYITELYKTYQMQDYLERYAMRLTKDAIDSYAPYYEAQMILIRRMPYQLVIISCIAVAFLLYITKAMTSNMIFVLSDLAKTSAQIEEKNFSIEDVKWEGQDELGQLVCAFNKMKRATGAYLQTLKEKHEIEEKLYRQEIEKVNLEQRISFAQLQLIKSQLNPHFLFNTLNMITRMAQSEEAPITEDMLIAMSNLLRYSLRTSDPFVPLRNELKVLEDYMYIQRMRFGERISWNITCEVPVDEIEIPVFLIQPLVENSIIHGISDKEDGGSISVHIYSKEDILHIIVKDTGIGIEEDKLNHIRDAIKGRGGRLGIGVGNIYRRLLAYYEHSEVSVDSVLGEGTTVKISFGKRK